MSVADAEAIGAADNDRVEAVNPNGVVVARAVVSHRMPPGTVFMYHVQERLVNVPRSEATGRRAYRRLRVSAVRRSSSRGDRAALPLLVPVLLAGLTATASSVTDPYDYRLGVAVWFRSLFALDPDVGAMAHAPLVHRLHAPLALALFALWPFSRPVHAFAVPLGYVVRRYVVYRSRGTGTRDAVMDR